MSNKFLIFIGVVLLLFLSLPKLVMVGLGIVLGLLLSTAELPILRRLNDLRRRAWKS